jgi:hypothetical protein
MAALVGRGIARVPRDRTTLERLGDEGGIDDARRPGRNERQAENGKQGKDSKGTAQGGPFSRRC